MYGKIKSRMTALILAFLSVTMLCGGAKTVFASETGAAQSSNAHLKSLKVEPGTLSPEFSEDVTAYTLTVDEDVESVKVTCSLAESSAKVIEAGGFKSLAAGSNDALIKVQAEDGTVCVYNITIIRGSAAAGEGTQGEGNAAPEEAGEPGNASAPEETGEPADGQESGGAQGEAVPISASGDKIPVGGDDIFASFLVNKSFSAPLPEGFTQEEYQYKGVPVQSARYAAGDLRLLYLTAGDGTSGDFRIYYEDDDVFLDFLQIKGLEGRFIMPVRFQAQMKVPDNYTDSFLPWGDKVIDCYIYTELTGAKMSYEEDENGDVKLVAGDSADASKPVHIEELKEEPEFYLLYAMNETGAEGFYLYDSVEGTYQRYVERDTSYDLDQSYFKYKTIAHQRFAFMCVMTAFLVIAVIVIINLVMRNKELLADLEDEDEDRQTAKKKKRDAPKPGKTKPRRETAERDGTEKAAGTAVRTGAAGVPVKKAGEAQKAAPQKTAAQKTAPQKTAAQKTAPQKAPVQKTTTQKAPVQKAAAQKAAVKEPPVREPYLSREETDSLEEKIISQLQSETIKAERPVKAAETKKPVQRPAQKTAGGQKTRPGQTVRKQSEFKMINLSRESEKGGIDDDFEFEFINLEDD